MTTSSEAEIERLRADMVAARANYMAEIERLCAVKTAALKLADERAKEACELRQRVKLMMLDSELGASELVTSLRQEVERRGAALVSIGILNASGPHPDPEIDRVVREYATHRDEQVEMLREALKNLYLLACASPGINMAAAQMYDAGKLLASFEQSQGKPAISDDDRERYDGYLNEFQKR